MSNSSPPPFRKLERSRDNRVFGGVCAGAASYLNMDPTLVRVLTVVLSFFTGVPIVLYLLALFLVPEESDGQPPQGYPSVAGQSWTYDPYPSQAGQSAGYPSYAPGPGSSSAPPRQYGVAPTGEDEAIWGAGGAPWQQPPTTRGAEPGPSDGPAQGRF